LTVCRVKKSLSGTPCFIQFVSLVCIDTDEINLPSMAVRGKRKFTTKTTTEQAKSSAVLVIQLYLFHQGSLNLYLIAGTTAFIRSSDSSVERMADLQNKTERDLLSGMANRKRLTKRDG